MLGFITIRAVLGNIGRNMEENLYIFKMEDNLNFWETTFIFLQMEEDLIILL